MSEVSSSGFVSPADYSEEWRDITLAQIRSHSLIYTASRYGRRFLLKALPQESAGLTDFRLQQEQEFLLGIRLVHPNIAATYSLEDVKGIGRCIVQEWIDGITMDEWLETKPSRAAKERVFGQILNALEYIHSIQLVHHDLKADNILITRNGTNVKLIDFGLSAIDATLSPVENDPQKDIEPLGRLMAEMLPHQRMIARRCRNGQYTTIASLRRAMRRRAIFIRLIPVLLSALLLIAAASFFYLAWHERHTEQQRYEAMVALIDTYMEQERAQLLEIANRREAYNRSGDMEKFMACFDEYTSTRHRYWAIRDSLINSYEENDPLREQGWSIWSHKENMIDIDLAKYL